MTTPTRPLDAGSAPTERVDSIFGRDVFSRRRDAAASAEGGLSQPASHDRPWRAAGPRGRRRRGGQHEGLGHRERRESLHPLVPAADRTHRGEARFARGPGRPRRRRLQLLGLRAGAGRARRFQLSLRRAPRDVRGSRVHRLGRRPAPPSSCGATTTSPSASRPHSSPGPARPSTPRSRSSARWRRSRARRSGS